MARKLTQTDKQAIAADLVESSDPGIMFAIMDKYGLTPETLADAMLDAGVERCPECFNWVESGELVDKGLCDSCYPLAKFAQDQEEG
jgi:uncharacterized protein (UPF0212 family)